MTMVSIINCCKPIGGNYNKNQGASIWVPTTTTSCNLHFHKTLLLSKPQPRSSLLRCCASLSASAESSFLSILKPAIKPVIAGLLSILNRAAVNVLKPAKPVISVKIEVVDEDGQLQEKIDKLMDMGSNAFDVKKKINIVLDEVVPLLLANAHHWISSALTVTPNWEESFFTLNMDEFVNALHLHDGIRCTRVFVDLSVIGVLVDDKFKDIHTREDLERLLHHLMSMEGILSAFAVCHKTRVPKEKTKALEDYSHVTT